jgi:hypothetical protein
MVAQLCKQSSLVRRENLNVIKDGNLSGAEAISCGIDGVAYPQSELCDFRNKRRWENNEESGATRR